MVVLALMFALLSTVACEGHDYDEEDRHGVEDKEELAVTTPWRQSVTVTHEFAGEVRATRSDRGAVWIDFDVSEVDYLNYQAAKAHPPVRWVMANDQPYGVPGEISNIAGDFDRTSHTVVFRASFPNPGGVLKPGDTGRVQVPIATDELLIPQWAAFDHVGQKFVFVVDDSNVVHLRGVGVSSELPHAFVVNEGLSEHDRILVEGQRKVHDGSVIEPDLL